ncbi:MAG: Stk1 family PASTA domain-containing Ser/Thr kinase [Clostridia bacterium]|nr:Stk1 family PASTA domain-containing Ser/Thr kinase [Clostridia bacterium]
MDLKGRLLGNRYEIIEKIGSGGMATVYKAKCHVLNRYVAIKILRDEFTTDEEFIKRFDVEAQSAASIAHPNIVSVYDVGVDGNLYYIVMELIKGKTLKEIIIEEKGPLPWKWSINIAIQIASALEIAHKNHIIHRDIKPHNIIITEDGIAKVTDFGIAKAVSNSTITAFGTTIGSVHYFSPEHARGGFTDEKSDLYSLGVVIYEMLTGKVPFDADTPVSVALKHMQEEPKPAIELNSNIPLAVNDIIMKALKKDTSLRYENATSMLLDLKRSLKEPSGNFVDNSEYIEDFPTQRISTLGIEEETRGTKEKDKKKKKANKFVLFIKKHKVLSSIIGLILLFAISLGLTIGISNATRPKEVAIPDLVGKTAEEAKQILEENNIKYVEEEPQYSTEVEEGKIISQNPPFVEGRKIKEETEIKVVVSLGTETTTVPKLSGLTKEEAEEAAKEAKIELDIIEEKSKKVEAGIIIKQDIEEGETVNAGDTVKVYLSIGTGIKQVVVTSVLYKDEETAKATLSNLGLKVSVEYDENKDRGNGVVLKQSISSGTTVDEGSEIIITVNKLVETKSGKLYINVKSLTNYKDKIKEKDEDGNEVEKDNTPEDVTLKVVVDGKTTVANRSVKENSTREEVNVNGKGTITIEVWIEGELKKTVNMNLKETTEITIP